MPWCETCAKFWTPSSMTSEGACPQCGRALDAPTPASPRRLSGADLRKMAGESGRAPWHFKLMVGALVAYLGWRLVQLVLLLFR